MAPHTRSDAAAERQRRLDLFTEVCEACDCWWPFTVYRNRTGHASDCPAHDVILRHLRGDDGSIVGDTSQ